MFDEENQLKDAEEYRSKMERLAVDCMEGNVGAISCHHAAEYFTTVDRDYHKSHGIYKFNCDRFKYAASCYETGAAYLLNRGVTDILSDDITGAAPFASDAQQDEYGAKGEEYLSKACERKHFGACHILAKHYYGLAHSVTAAASASFKVNLLEGAPPEAAAYLEKSLAMSERACKYSNGDSCAFLGMHWLRRDIPKQLGTRDPVKASVYMRKACDKCSNLNSCFNLAVLLKLGDTGVSPNLEESMLYQKKTVAMANAQSVDLAKRVRDNSTTW